MYLCLISFNSNLCNFCMIFFEMETELETLYNVLNFYKRSLVEILEKIDEKVLQASTNYKNAHNRESSTKKYKISQEIVDVLPKYVRMLYTCETISEEIASKLAQLEQDTPPEREKRNSNPFITYNIKRETDAGSSSVQEQEPPSASDKFKQMSTPDRHEEVMQEFEHKTAPFIAYNIHQETDAGSSRVQQQEPLSATDKLQQMSTPDRHEEVVQEFEPKTVPFITYNIQQKTDAGSSKVQQQKPPSATDKLKQMSIPDRYEEVMQEFEHKTSHKTFKLIPKAPEPEAPRNKLKKKPRNFDIADGTLSVGRICVVSHIESPSEFYLRADQTLFIKFEELLNEDVNKQTPYVVNKFETKEEARTHLGNFCLGFRANKQKWYRMEVVDWMDNEDSDLIRVQLIDYGETLFWSYTNLKPLTELHSLFCKMAVRCHLAGVYSPDPDDFTRWPQESTNFFAQLCEMESQASFITIFVHKENHSKALGDSYAVDLKKAHEINADSVGELMVTNNYACMERVSSEEPDFDDDDLEDADNINELISGYDAQDEARICPFTDSSGGCYKGARCKLEHCKLSKDGITTDKILTTQQAMAKLILPETGQDINVLITGYITTCHFYVHILNKCAKDSPFNEDFQRLLEVMSTNNIVQNYTTFKIYPGIGELVLVKEESKWYRGTCVGFTDNEEIEVFLVDFGFKIVKKLKELREMKEDFLYVPFQAVECILFDCQEKKEAASLSHNFFNKAMKMKSFSARVIESGSPLRLQLWDSQGMDMSHVLKQYEIGEDRGPDFCPVQDCFISCD